MLYSEFDTNLLTLTAIPFLGFWKLLPTFGGCVITASTAKLVEGKIEMEVEYTLTLTLTLTLPLALTLTPTLALTLTQSGLEVAVVWRHGRKVPTPAASFMAHAMRALHATLRALGSGLVVLYAADESEESAAEAVAARALQLGVDYVIVDACEAAGAAAAGLVAAALRRSIIEPRSQTDAQSDAEPLTMPTVEAMVDDTLFPHDVTDRHSNLRPTDLQTR